MSFVGEHFPDCCLRFLVSEGFTDMHSRIYLTAFSFSKIYIFSDTITDLLGFLPPPPYMTELLFIVVDLNLKMGLEPYFIH